MKINEIFYSIQGEGKWTGFPNVFIRLSGCNLRCSFCDTSYAYEDGFELDINRIMKKIQRYPSKKICITGGEPLLQEDVYELVDSLLKDDYEICLETNGSINVGRLTSKKSTMISLDVKCPSSDMQKYMDLNNIKLLSKKDQLKFIIQSKKDYDFAKKTIEKFKPKCTVFFQPVYGTNTAELSSWILKDGLCVRLGLQIHKIIWGDGKAI